MLDAGYSGAETRCILLMSFRDSFRVVSYSMSPSWCFAMITLNNNINICSDAAEASIHNAYVIPVRR